MRRNTKTKDNNCQSNCERDIALFTQQEVATATNSKNIRVGAVQFCAVHYFGVWWVWTSCAARASQCLECWSYTPGNVLFASLCLPCVTQLAKSKGIHLVRGLALGRDRVLSCQLILLTCQSIIISWATKMRHPPTPHPQERAIRKMSLHKGSASS